jgi:DNA-binding MarR family transcriptional regulator
MIGSREDLVADALRHIETLASYRRRAFCAQPHLRDVSLPQLHILAMLKELGTMTVSEIANTLSISAPSATSIIDRMEEHGLATRERDREDRRVVHVRISQRGQVAVEEMMGMKRDRVHGLLEVMTDQELGDLIKGIEALQSALDRLQRTDVPA